MEQSVAHPLVAWESFYVIVGSSAAALTGLQFVVIALIAESERRNSSKDTLAAFGTPNVVHFCAALLVAAILSAPWRALSSAGMAIVIAGLGGAAYSAIVVRRARRQREYIPVLEDWIWHAILPTMAYTTLVVAASFLTHRPEPALFLIGGGALLLLFIGIHNAWDTVTYLALDQSAGQGSGDQQTSTPAVPASAPTAPTFQTTGATPSQAPATGAMPPPSPPRDGPSSPKPSG